MSLYQYVNILMINNRIKKIDFYRCSSHWLIKKSHRYTFSKLNSKIRNVYSIIFIVLYIKNTK